MDWVCVPKQKKSVPKTKDNEREDKIILKCFNLTKKFDVSCGKLYFI